MFHNIGKTLKGWAVGTFFVEAISAVVGGFCFFIFGDNDAIWGLPVLFGGLLTAYFSAMLLGGFGELIDKTCSIEKHLTRRGTGSGYRNVSSGKQRKLDELLRKELITREEYQEALFGEGENEPKKY